MKLSLHLPCPLNLRSQGYAANANPLYAGQGLKGHTSDDWGMKWGADGFCLAPDSYVYSVMNKDHLDPMKYRAVFTLVEGDNGLSNLAEVSYGHCSEIFAEVGKTYQPGDLLYKVGNTGDVYAGSQYVTREMKLAGSKAGAHLHGPQVRPVKRVKRTNRNKQYLYDGSGILKLDGYYFEVIDYDNGYNGCIDPSLFYNGIVAKKPEPKQFPFSRDLYIGMNHPEVKELQKFLNSQGYTVSWLLHGSVGNETEYFGYLTQHALRRFQKAKGINPPAGYFGPITRKFIAGL